MSIADIAAGDELVRKATEYSKEYMGKYDASHDFNHILRVVGLSQHIHAQSVNDLPADLRVVTLSALLHDVGDTKYLEPGEDGTTMVYNILRGFGADHELADRVQTICLGVSYRHEVKNPEKVKELIQRHPELAIVQDADRLDAIGAVGIGRVFAFGTRSNRPLESSVAHFEEKLLLVHAMMKTEAGKKLAKDRHDRLVQFRKWWDEENEFAASRN
jgi:uncharacterized protein